MENYGYQQAINSINAVRIVPCRLVRKTRMVWLPDGKNKFEDMFMTDNRTDILRRHSLHYAQHRAVKIRHGYNAQSLFKFLLVVSCDHCYHVAQFSIYCPSWPMIESDTHYPMFDNCITDCLVLALFSIILNILKCSQTIVTLRSSYTVSSLRSINGFVFRQIPGRTHDHHRQTSTDRQRRCYRRSEVNRFDTIPACDRQTDEQNRHLATAQSALCICICTNASNINLSLLLTKFLQLLNLAIFTTLSLLYTALFHQKIGSTQQFKKEKERKTTI